MRIIDKIIEESHMFITMSQFSAQTEMLTILLFAMTKAFNF